jgi:LacI family transcriptional regulator
MAKATGKSRRLLHVAVIVHTSTIYGREIMSGIGRYLRIHPEWLVFTTEERGRNYPEPPWLTDWQGDGIITHSMNDMRLCRAAAARGIPVVSVRYLNEAPYFPTVFSDQQLTTRRIAEHLLERGFRHFGYVGTANGKGWEQLRRESFVQILLQNGIERSAIKLLHADPKLSWERWEERVAAAVRRLPLPIGIMVNSDSQGVQLLNACRLAKVRVPDDVAIVSVGNDPVLCEIANPPLSSLDYNAAKLGFEAATLLSKMMRGEKVATRNYFVEPGQVVARQSSDVLAAADPSVAKAIRFIRDHACDGIGVDAVAQQSGMSRDKLERRFRQFINRTPLEEIQEMRLRRVKQLLLETDYVLPQIAEMAGFEYQEYMVRFFKKRTGLTPGVFRRKRRFVA